MSFQSLEKLINYFADLSRVGQGGEIADRFDLADNSSHDNQILVPTTPYAYAVLMSTMNGDDTPYTSGSKRLTFDRNDYRTPDVTGPWFYWQANKDWAGWQAVPQDAAGKIGVR